MFITPTKVAFYAKNYKIQKHYKICQKSKNISLLFSSVLFSSFSNCGVVDSGSYFFPDFAITSNESLIVEW
jgi:hypothetical protein